MTKAVGQFTIIDLNDITISSTAPAVKIVNMIWLDTSVVPNQLKKWSGTAWINIGDRNEDLEDTIDQRFASYYTKTEITSAINQTKDSIYLSVDQKINQTATTINTRTDEVLESYSTTTLMNTAIALSQDSILSTVGVTYATKDSLGNYSTTTQMNTAISQTATSITSTVSATYATKTSVSTLSQTVGGFETRISNAEGDVTTIQQSTSGITAAVNAAKLEFNSSGLTIKNGGFKIMDGNTTLLSSTSGNVQITGGFTSGYATMNSQGLWLSPYKYVWSGEPSGGRIYFDTNSSVLKMTAVGWSISLQTSGAEYKQHYYYSGYRHTFTGGDVYITGNLYVNDVKIN